MIDFRTELPLEQRQVIGAAGLAALLAVARCDGEPSARALAAIAAVRDHLLEQAAAALEVDPAPVRSFQQVMEQRLGILRLDIARRGFIAAAARTTLQQEGLRGALGVARVLLAQGDPAMAERYRVLREYPAGSFGKAYADFIDRNHFGFPGEVGGPPPPVMHHDCCHVLGGYGTTAAEEGAVLGFQAGFERLDPFYVLLFALAEFELGIGASPFIPGERQALDLDRLFAGIAHGSQVTVDLIADINPWDHFADPLQQVRERFNVLPRGREPEWPA